MISRTLFRIDEAGTIKKVKCMVRDRSRVNRLVLESRFKIASVPNNLFNRFSKHHYLI